MWLPGQDATKVKSAAPVAISPAVDVWSVNPTPDSPTNLNDRLIAALVYVTFIPAILVLMIPAFRPNRFLRFHAYQSILFTIATVLVAIGVRILFSILTLIPAVGFLLAWLFMTVVALGLAIVWLVLLAKALQGQTFRLPWLGNLASKA